jgi:3-hydroxypropanoate dehydrogenase
MQVSTEQLFTEARSHNGWLDTPVPEATLRDLHELLKWGPTSANCSPLRVLFVRSAEAKARLVPLMSAGNRDKTAQAPVTAILGMDLGFPDTLPKLFPHTDARSWFAGDEAKIAETAFRNSSLQGGYFILAARALGLDCGPMSGFDAKAVDAAFWVGTQVRTNFVCSLGHGDPAKLFGRSPRPAFDEVCRVL